MDKYCRICWNSAGWRRPTGEASRLESGDSYVQTHGFGHEEWLFRLEWLSESGDRYAFLQPINKYLSIYEGDTFSIALYPITPERETVLIGQLTDVHIPGPAEREKALDSMRSSGWLDLMRKELSLLGLTGTELQNPKPEEVVNVRFKPRNVRLYTPRVRVRAGHKIISLPRYHPINWDDGETAWLYRSPRAVPPSSPDDDDAMMRSEAARTRAAVEGVTYDPRHVQLQNRLYRALQRKYGKAAVRYEHEFVDLSVHLPNEVTFYEIKMEATAQRCIRLALGQLLEYSHYPDQAKANRFVVVGDAVPTEDDRIYLKWLREQYGIPVKYARFDWHTNDLLEA